MLKCLYKMILAHRLYCTNLIMGQIPIFQSKIANTAETELANILKDN